MPIEGVHTLDQLLADALSDEAVHASILERFDVEDPSPGDLGLLELQRFILSLVSSRLHGVFFSHGSARSAAAEPPPQDHATVRETKAWSHLFIF